MTFDLAGQIGSVVSSKFARGVGVAAFGLTLAKAMSNRRPFDVNQLIPENLIFPRDLANYPMSISFDFYEYKRRAVNVQPHLKSTGQIRLPVPKSMIDKYTMNWDKHNQTPMVGAAIESILEESQRAGNTISPDDIAGRFQSAVGSITTVAGDVGAGFGVTQAKKVLESASQAVPGEKLELADILQPLGFAENPFMTVLFKSPEFKNHSFAWRLIPRDPEEARIINKIIRLFKYALLPDIATGSGGTLLNYPNIVQVGFYGGDNYLYRFKPCAIKNMTANYAPAPTPSFFKGSQNVPTEIDFSVDLMEIEYWTKQDLQSEKGYDPNSKTVLSAAAEVAIGGAIT